uniref:3-phosphoglycerate dehydrogenase n=1 Tax=Fervidicoccus fontis TaxID=683846 RepID=A0A7J3ZL28_9CREN
MEKLAERHGHITTLPNVLIADPVDPVLVDGLKTLGLNVLYMPSISRKELLDYIENCEVLVVRSRTLVDREVFERAKRLKIVARAGVGLDNIDVDEAERRGVHVICAPEAPVQSVAELTIGLMIAAARRVVEASERVRQGEWIKTTGVELYGKTLGIVGFGRIGYRVAEIARAMGMKIVVYDVTDVSQKAERVNATLASTLEDLLSVSDVISLHVPLTRQTYHMISYRELEVAKNGVIVVNTSRGAVIDAKALLEALKRWKVSAAALDVLENEPPKEPWELELIRHPRVIVTPHIGSQTLEAQRRIAIEVLDKIKQLVLTRAERVA